MAKSGVEMDYPYTDEDVEFAVGRLSQVKRMLPNKTGVILDRLGLHRGAGSWMLLREDVIVGKVFRIYKLSPKYMLVVVRPLFQGQDLLRMANTPWVDTELVEDFRIVPAESEE